MRSRDEYATPCCWVGGEGGPSKICRFHELAAGDQARAEATVGYYVDDDLVGRFGSCAGSSRSGRVRRERAGSATPGRKLDREVTS